MLYSEWNTDNRDEVKQSRRHMSDRQPDAGKDKPEQVANHPYYCSPFLR
jgi:hypothetical protein